MSTRCVVKMRRGGERKCKTREGSPAISREVGLPARGSHIPSAAAERRKKPREDPRHGTTSRGRESMRRTSPPAKRRKVIEVTSSTSEEAEEYKHGRSMSEREASLRYGSIPPQIMNVVCFVLTSVCMWTHIECSDKKNLV